jgi:chromosome segregation ATPase
MHQRCDRLHGTHTTLIDLMRAYLLQTKISELTERIQALENCDSSGTSAIEEQLRARAEEAEEELKEFAAYTDEIEVEKSRLEAELASRIADLSTAEEIISSMEDFIKKLESRTDQPTPMALMQMVAEYCGSSTCENSPSAMCGNVKDSAVEYKSLEKLEAQKVLAEEAAAALRSELDVLAASSAAEIADLRASLADLQRHEAIGVSVDAHLAGNSSPDASEDNSIKVSDPYDALAISDDEISDDEQGNAPLHVCQENNSGLSDKSSCAGATEHIGKNVLEAQIGELQQRLVTLSEAERVSFELKEAVISLQSRVQEQDLAAAQAMEEKAEKENRIAELLTQISMGALESDPDGITKDVQTDEDQERKELQQQCIKFREESACYETCVGMLEEDLLAAKAELAALVSETKKKNFDFDGLSREISAKQEELQNANADLESLVAHLRMQYNTASLELEEKTQELHALAEEASAVKLLMEQRIADLEGEAASTAQTLQELSAKPDSTLAASQIAELKACLGSLQNEKATLADALQEATLHLDQKTEAYTAQIAELQANMEEARAQRCDLEGSLQELCLRLECLQGEAATSQSYEEVLKHAQCEVADRTADVLRLQEQHALLEEDATAYRTKLHDVSSALSQAQVDGHEKSATILSLRMHVELLTVSARAAEHRGALAEERAVELESKKAAYDELAERITEERSLMETRILNMESALEETVLQKKEAEEALQVLADQIAEMEAAKSDADSLRDELTAALEESESLGKEVIELTEQMDVKSADISELRNKVDSLESLLQAAEDAAALHLAGLQQCRLELEKSELEATNLSDRLRELLESSATGVEVENELRLQLSELRAAIASLESEKCAALSQVGQLGANIAEYKEKFAEASSAMGLLPEVQLLLSKAENEKVEAKQVCLDLRSQVASLELELQATKQAVEGLQKLEEDLASRDKDADNLSERLAAAESALVTAIENERQGMHMLENTVAEAESVQADLLQKLEDALAEIKRTAARSNELAESLKRSEGNNSLLEQEVGSKTAALAELESAFDHLKHEQSGTESDELLREMELLMEGKLSAESRAAGMERELCELRESVQDAEQRAASEQKMVIKAAEERIANSISEVELLTEKIAILEADQEVKSERIKKLEEVRLTKEQVEKLNKMKETSKRNERQNRELSAEVTKLRQQLANGINKDAAAQLAELETIKESLSEKLRKYASHCQKLEGERGSLMAALQQAGVDIDASDDIAEAVYTLIEQRSVHSPSSDDEAAALRKQLSDGMTRYYQLENDFKRVQAELDKVVGERGEEEEEQTRQVRFLEGENLQLMLEIKEVKKQATQLRAELEALNSKHGEEASMTPSKLSSSTSRRQSSARVPRSASKSSTGNPCIEKENMVNMSAATSAAISAAKPGVVKKSRARALIEQGPEDESAGECKQS